jgi:hypothetical protein
MSFVQGLLSFGTFVSSATDTMFPAPSHTFAWQVPLIWIDVLVPCGLKLLPHCPVPEQAIFAHSVPTPGQSAGTLHPTQFPSGVHTPIAQAVPVGIEDTEGTPFLQLPVWQLPAGFGASVSSATIIS